MNNREIIMGLYAAFDGGDIDAEFWFRASKPPRDGIGDPGGTARAIAFLASDEASFITGTTLTADGGFHLTL